MIFKFPEVDCNHLQWLRVISIGLGFVALAYMIFISVYFIRKLKPDKQSVMNKYLHWISYFLIITTIVSAISILSQNLACIIGIEAYMIYPLLAMAFLWVLNQGTTILIFLLRLYDVFKNTSYAYSDKTWMIFRILFIIECIAGLTGCIVLSFNLFIGLFLGAITLLGYVTFAVVVLYLFINGLFKVSSNTRDIGSISNEQDISVISDMQLILIKTMSKYVVLVSISLLTTFISLLILFIRAIVFINTHVFNDVLGVSLHYLTTNWMYIDLICNLLSFMFQFSWFGNAIYYKYCNKMDVCCQKLVKKQTVKDMKRKSIQIQLNNIQRMTSDENSTIEATPATPISVKNNAQFIESA